MKYYNDKGEVGVLVSRGWGAGWSSWCSDPCISQLMLFDPVIVEAVLADPNNKDRNKLERIAKERYPEQYVNGIRDYMSVEFLPPGTPFKINEFDGAEDLITLKDLNYIA